MGRFDLEQDMQLHPELRKGTGYGVGGGWWVAGHGKALLLWWPEMEGAGGQGMISPRQDL